MNSFNFMLSIILIVVLSINIAIDIINHKPKKYYRITVNYIKDNHYYIIKARDKKDAELKVRKKINEWYKIISIKEMEEDE